MKTNTLYQSNDFLLRSSHQAYVAFGGSDGAYTRATTAALERRGTIGQLAGALFRAQKASSRAKQYRGNYRGLAYGRKGEHLESICYIMLAEPHPEYNWGWGVDFSGYYSDVLYIDLPQGQVSFHSEDRFDGPDYPGEWDQQHASEDRILAFSQWVLDNVAEVPRTRSISRKRVCKPKATYVCEHCGKMAETALKTPRGWVRNACLGVSFLVCDEVGCFGEKIAEIKAPFLSTEYKVPCGKYAGKSLCELPQDYMDWVLENVKDSSTIFQLCELEASRRQDS